MTLFPFCPPSQDGTGTPVTDAECGLGFIYNAANAWAPCAGETCDVEPAGSADDLEASLLEWGMAPGMGAMNW